MAWCQLDDTFCDHPKFDDVAADLGVPVVHVRGHLATLWSWTIRHAPDGHLGRYSNATIARRAEWAGDPDEFVAALLSRRLLDETPTGLQVHKWMDRAGSYKRARQKAKERASESTVGDCRATVVRQSSDGVATVASQRTGQDRTGPDLTQKNWAPTEGGALVLAHYLATYPDRGLQADLPESRRVVNQRLKSYTADQLIQAIDGNRADDWAQSRGLNSVKHIFGKIDTIDKFIGLAKPKPKPKAPGTWGVKLTGDV